MAKKLPLRCRLLGHKWAVHSAIHYRNIDATLENRACARCSTWQWRDDLYGGNVWQNGLGSYEALRERAGGAGSSQS